jgi:hypothetical protein
MTRSQTRTAVFMLLLAGFAGCAAPKPPELDYLPPSGQPAAERSAFVRQRPWLLWGNILDHLQQQGVQVSIVNEAGGELVVFYNGDPQPYVDCGWIVTYRGAELDRVPAAASDASFLRRRDGEVVTLERELKLDARMRVDVEPSGDDHRADRQHLHAYQNHQLTPGQAAFPRRDDRLSYRRIGGVQLRHRVPADWRAGASGVRRPAHGVARWQLAVAAVRSTSGKPCVAPGRPQTVFLEHGMAARVV